MDLTAFVPFCSSAPTSVHFFPNGPPRQLLSSINRPQLFDKYIGRSSSRNKDFQLLIEHFFFKLFLQKVKIPCVYYVQLSHKASISEFLEESQPH